MSNALRHTVGDYVGTIQSNGEYSKEDPEHDWQRKCWLWSQVWERVVDQRIPTPCGC